ncbi:MAG: nucleoside deaminase [Bacteroidetes bacterium]|nr:nucleoside deaminase [Bacteroidota bacterium]MCB0856161.1 nucleoside deaminase [Bacteroidota bacterium]
MHTDEHFMRQAWLLAQQAMEDNEVPIGAVVVCDYRIIGRGYNQTERLQDPTAHAEMIAITAACEYLGSKYLQDCSLFVTIEPCVMCAGAIRWAQIDKLVFGAQEPKTGFSRHQPGLLHPKTQIVSGIMEDDCRALMQDFFRKKR